MKNIIPSEETNRFEKLKSIDEAIHEIFSIMDENGLFGIVYLEDGISARSVNFSASPYHAGALVVRASAFTQGDYKKLGEDTYNLFRKGMKDAAQFYGAKLTQVEKGNDD